MKRILIWDAPVRLFHWLLAGLFVVALAIATLSSDEGPLFPLHALFGFVILFLLILRIVWGFVGTRWARFESFSLSPRKLLGYLRSTIPFANQETLYAGHNPATSWFVLALLVTLAGLGVTGIMMARGNESVGELHEVLAWAVLVMAGVHVAGVLVHTIRRRENLAFAMIDGKKEACDESAIHSSRWGSAFLLIVLSGAWTAMLVKGYDPAARRLAVPFFGATMQIGESENSGSRERAPAGEQQHHDDDHDNDDDD